MIIKYGKKKQLHKFACSPSISHTIKWSFRFTVTCVIVNLVL